MFDIPTFKLSLLSVVYNKIISLRIVVLEAPSWSLLKILYLSKF